MIFKNDLDMFEEKLHELGLKYFIEDFVRKDQRVFYFNFIIIF